MVLPYGLVRQIAIKITRNINRNLSEILTAVASYYTPLALLLALTIGNTVIWMLSYICRYDRWNYWHWRGRAIHNMVRWSVMLIAVKILLTGRIT